VPEPLRAAHEALKRRLQAERLRYAEIVADLSGEPGAPRPPRDQLERELADAREYITSLESALREKEDELARVYAEIERLSGGR
jgi:hypothetical protein